MDRLYPLYADLRRRRVVVFGAGTVAERKLAGLLDTGADIVVVAASATAQVQTWQREGRLRWIKRSLSEHAHWRGWLDTVWLHRQIRRAWLVLVASDNRKLNRRIVSVTERCKVLTNVVDDLELTHFHVPAVLRRGPMQAAISSAGVAPALARRLRAQLEVLLDDDMGRLAQLLADQRARIKQAIPDTGVRRRWYDTLLDGQLPELVRSGRMQAAEHCLDQALQTSHRHSNDRAVEARGRVVLVGAGPGDPGLLTIQALRELQQADVIVHDRLVSDAVLNLARRDAERILVAKRAGDHATTQERIHSILLEQARAGRYVVRLKGGDPFVFGRGGEELEVLRAHDIDYAVVPGISAAMACAAYSGVPLTHREHAQSVRLVTAHCQRSMDRLDWAALAEDSQTLAIYMGVAQLDVVQQRLLQHGRSAATPFALIENGTRDNQRIVTGSLSNLPDTAKAFAIQPPAMLLLGPVAALANTLHWYGTAPQSLDTTDTHWRRVA